MHPTDFRPSINGSLRGERKAQQELFRSLRGLVYGIVHRILQTDDRAEIEDVIQKAYIEIFRSLSSFQWRCSFETWVYRICSATCMMRLREKYRRRKVGSESFEVDSCIDPTPGPDMIVQQRESICRIRRGLDALRPERRMVFILADVEGCSLQECAVIMKCGIGTVKSRLFRARADMERELMRDASGDLIEEVTPREPASAVAAAVLCAVILSGLGGMPMTPTGMPFHAEVLQ